MVGIGTTTPDNKLDVKGRLRAEEVIVEEGWADFVFDDDYVLPTLEEEKHHIDLKGHLIGFESEEAMDGEIQIGDVTKRQQQKIEELVLHTIGLNEKVKEQQMINEKLKSELAAIKMLMDEIKTQLKD